MSSPALQEIEAARVQLPRAFQGLARPYRFKVFYGGRGAAKSRTFARALLLQGTERKHRVLCAREIQNSIKDSVKRLLDDEIHRLGLEAFYLSTDNEIRGKNGTLFIFSGLRQNPERVKSFEGITRVWIEEAETISERSWDLLTPTIREEESEVWVSFNPDRINGVIYQKFVVNAPPPNSLVVKVSWRDNPWFPDVLRKEMEHCKKIDPDKYDHVWEGNPVLVAKGSYYGSFLQHAKDSGRIGRVPVEPTTLVHTAWDLGISDSMAIWFFQWLPVGRFGEFRWVDYYEANGEGLPHYAHELERRGYKYGRHIGPHDLAVRELGTGKSRIEKARELGIRFETCPNIPVQDGIEAVRNVLDASWFDHERCGQGLESLWAYQREWDDINGCFKDRPKHDWASNGADAFRYAAVGFDPPHHIDVSKLQRDGA